MIYAINEDMNDIKFCLKKFLCKVLGHDFRYHDGDYISPYCKQIFCERCNRMDSEEYFAFWPFIKIKCKFWSYILKDRYYYYLNKIRHRDDNNDVPF